MKVNIAGVNETLYKEKLSNGLELYIIPNKNVKNYYITMTTKFGSNHTEFKRSNDKEFKKVPNGIAHFLEHLTFKMEDGDASEYFPTIGCQSNAYTNYDATCYEVYGYKNFKEALNYMLDFIQTPYYNEKNVQAEKGIICEELKMRNDNPGIRLFEKFYEIIFKNEPYKNAIGGTIKEVKSTTLQNILDCYNTFYHPSNMFMVITGNVNPEEAIAIVEENQSKKKFEESFEVILKEYEEPDELNSTNERFKANVEIEKVAIGLKIPLSIFKNIKIPKELLSIYISIILNSNFGRSSEIRERVVSGNIVTDGIYVNKFFTDEHLIIKIVAETPYPKRFTSIIKEGIENISITEDDLKRKKRVGISNYILSFDDIEQVNSSIVEDMMEFGAYQTDLYEKYSKLNIKTAEQIAKKLKTDNITVLTMEKEDE